MVYYKGPKAVLGSGIKARQKGKFPLKKNYAGICVLLIFFSQSRNLGDSRHLAL